jgi:fibrillarin-like pre-rRNA processing protein
MAEIVLEKFPGIFLINGKLATKNLVPGKQVYGEELIIVKGTEYRIWDPEKSKLAAAIMKGVKVEMVSGTKILYLGIAHGTTASHLSDIIGHAGIIYGVEISPRPMRELLPVCEARKNIAPILADARKPAEYSWIEPVDVVYEDVADRQQVSILIKNCRHFLKPDGLAMLAVKARSIDVTKKPKEVYAQVLDQLQKGFKIIRFVKLDPYERDHCFILMQKV